MQAQSTEFGVLNGNRVDAITLKSASGLQVQVLTYGATIASVKVPSKASEAEEVTLCYGDLATLQKKSPYYGCTVGRVANRIAKGKFAVDGKEYSVATNNGPNHLHGGIVGWDKVLWSPRIFVTAQEAGVEFSYVSKDGEEGYPGTVKASATYKLTAANELVMEFRATTDAATPINMCNHTYWNLSGNLKSKIHDHVLALDCTHYVTADATLIPTGIVPVANTPFDFTAAKPVGKQLLEADGGGEPGYDHCFCRQGGAIPAGGLGLGRIAVLADPASGRKMTVSTTAPGVQLYTGNFLSKDAADAPHTQHGALCLETENYPDAVNQGIGEDAILRPGQQYEHIAIHKFEW